MSCAKKQAPSLFDRWSFCGDRWNHIKKGERQNYLKNAYRVLLTRARQGMVIVVPEGNSLDPTRDPKYYDPIFDYLKKKWEHWGQVLTGCCPNRQNYFSF